MFGIYNITGDCGYCVSLIETWFIKFNQLTRNDELPLQGSNGDQILIWISRL